MAEALPLALPVADEDRVVAAVPAVGHGDRRGAVAVVATGPAVQAVLEVGAHEGVGGRVGAGVTRSGAGVCAVVPGQRDAHVVDVVVVGGRAVGQGVGAEVDLQVRRGDAGVGHRVRAGQRGPGGRRDARGVAHPRVRRLHDEARGGGRGRGAGKAHLGRQGDGLARRERGQRARRGLQAVVVVRAAGDPDGCVAVDLLERRGGASVVPEPVERRVGEVGRHQRGCCRRRARAPAGRTGDRHVVQEDVGERGA